MTQVRPPTAESIPVIGVGPHTGFGLLTVLCQDSVGGLQVENLNGDWIVKDPTIVLDGKPVWENGVPQFDKFEITRNCLEKWPELKTLYTSEPGAIGL